VKHKLKFEWVKNSDKNFFKFKEKIFGKDSLEVFADSSASEEIDLSDFYPILKNAYICLDDKKIGVIGIYSSFMFNKDLWLGFIGFTKAYKDIPELEKNVLVLVEKYIKKKYDNITHIRIYDYEKRGKIDFEDYFLELGYVKSKRKYAYYKYDNIAICSKCLKGRFIAWERKPVW